MNTTITISRELKDKLDEIGKKSESYDTIVQRIYEHYMLSQQKTVQMFVRENIVKYGAEMSDIKREILQAVADGKSTPWSEVKKELEKED